MALFLFFWSNAALVTLLTSHYVVLKPLFPFRLAQFVEVFCLSLLHSAVFPMVTAIPKLCSFSFSPPTLALFPPLSLLPSVFRFTSNSLAYVAGTVFSLLVYYQATMVPDSCFSRGTTRLMSWLDGERYFCIPKFLVVSLLLPLVFTLVISLTEGELSHLHSSTN